MYIDLLNDSFTCPLAVILKLNGVKVKWKVTRNPEES